ncbi:ArsR/SmtB family transcription factor [Planctomycetota bacterium]
MRKTAELFRALGDETRLRMLWLLMNHVELCVCDFIEVLEITQSKASRHLRNLYHAGLVEDRRDGLWNYYSLKTKEEMDKRAVLQVLRRLLASRGDAHTLLASLDGWLERKERSSSCG